MVKCKALLELYAILVFHYIFRYHATMEPLMADGCLYIFERLDYIIPGKTGIFHLSELHGVHNRGLDEGGGGPEFGIQ